MVYDLKGKVVLVTGGANGIGLRMVKELIGAGVKAVAIADLDVSLGEKAVSTLGADKAVFYKTDVTKTDNFEDTIKKTIAKFGTLDVLVNNAGIFKEKNWEHNIAVNINAVVQGTLLYIKHMGKNNGGKGGVVINTGSILGLHCFAGGPVYTGTKHFVVSFGRSFGTPFYEKLTGVKVMTICPGFSDTDLLSTVEGLPGLQGVDEYCLNLIKQMKVQPPENVGKGLITLLTNGANGSAWVAEENKPAYEAKTDKTIFM